MATKVNRKLATEKQMNQLVMTSEQKNTPDDHYKLMIGLPSLEYARAAYEIGRLIKKSESVVPKVFEINQKITENPNYYVNEVDKEQDYAQYTLYMHKLNLFIKGLRDNIIEDMAISYLELKDEPSFKKMLDDKYEGVEDVIINYLKGLKLIDAPTEAYNKLIVK